jgi:POT family proton-dependent oligopeptide transporter
MSTTTTDAHLNKIFWSPSWIIYIISYRNVGAFFILWDESLLVLYMTSSTLGDDARGAGLGWTNFSIIRMVYHVSIHNVNSWRNDCG